MLTKISEEVEVKASISEAWDVYGTLKIALIVQSELGHLFGVDVLEGDGGVGTIVKVTPRPGVSVVPAYKERFMKIDHEKRVKELEIIEGGHLELGFTCHRVKFELFENKNDEESCIARVTIEYEANEDVIANADASVTTIKPLMTVIGLVNQYIQNNKT